MKKLLIVFTILMSLQSTSRAQVLMSLIFGDKLNSEKVEFGLLGGINFSNMSNLPGNEPLLGFHLGFYFDITLKEKLIFQPGVIVKSPLGTKGLATYPTGDANLDTVVQNGEVTRNLGYFHVPLLLKYRFIDHFFIEAGPQLGLLNKAFDEFNASVQDDDDVVHKVKIKDQTNRIEAGVTAGLGYKFFKGKGMNLGMRYFYGLTDTVKDNPGESV